MLIFTSSHRYLQIRQQIALVQYWIAVTKGSTVIHRKSSESSVTIPDRETTKDLLKKVHDALQGGTTYYANKDVRHCGYPDRLLLPKGKKEGMPFTLYVIVTNFETEKASRIIYKTLFLSSIRNIICPQYFKTPMIAVSEFRNHAIYKKRHSTNSYTQIREN